VIRSLRASVLLLVLTGAACSRAVTVNSQPAATVSLEVRNTFPDEMIVSYNDGSATRTLGSIPAGRTERFVIVPPASSSITVTARNSAGSRNFGPLRLTVSPGGTSSVVIR
jgi:hypothetical protein